MLHTCAQDLCWQREEMICLKESDIKSFLLDIVTCCISPLFCDDIENCLKTILCRRGMNHQMITDNQQHMLLKSWVMYFDPPGIVGGRMYFGLQGAKSMLVSVITMAFSALMKPQVQIFQSTIHVFMFFGCSCVSRACRLFFCKFAVAEPRRKTQQISMGNLNL